MVFIFQGLLSYVELDNSGDIYDGLDNCGDIYDGLDNIGDICDGLYISGVNKLC
jgi:hypothetical protein